MNTLIVGGTSGLGLELAQKFPQGKNDHVIVTGRHDPHDIDPDLKGLEFHKVDLLEPKLARRIGQFVSTLPEIDTLVYAAGFYQEGHLSELDVDDVDEMLSVGARGLIYFCQSLITNQQYLDELITVTSTSQWVPRPNEPVYNFVKSGAQHFSHAISKDAQVGDVLVVAPSGMNTRFWEDVERDDLDTMLDPAEVADVIMKVRDLDSAEYYREVQILRQPTRVNVVLRDGQGNVKVEPLELEKTE